VDRSDWFKSSYIVLVHHPLASVHQTKCWNIEPVHGDRFLARPHSRLATGFSFIHILRNMSLPVPGDLALALLPNLILYGSLQDAYEIIAKQVTAGEEILYVAASVEECNETLRALKAMLPAASVIEGWVRCLPSSDVKGTRGLTCTRVLMAPSFETECLFFFSVICPLSEVVPIIPMYAHPNIIESIRKLKLKQYNNGQGEQSESE
jgi:hypothetical protein